MSPPNIIVPALISKLAEIVKGLEPIVFTMSELDAMEKRLQITSAKLRGMRNSLQPINRLPPELLTHIFSEVQLRLPSFLPLPSSGAHDYIAADWCEWLWLLQVCRHWRGVIASSPALWSNVCSSGSALEFLRRSQGAELTVYLGVRFPGFSPTLMEALAPHTSRFKEFHMLAEGPELQDVLKQKLFSSPAPRMTSLLIEMEGVDDLSSVLPPIFRGHMPKLKHLALGYFTSWPKGYFRNITSLCLYHQKESSWSSTTEFLDFLADSPRIEEICLIRGGPMRPSGTDVPPAAGRYISLKRLRKLDIGEWPSAFTIARFLSHLSLPRTTEMYIWGHIFRDHENIASILPEDISRLRNLKAIKTWYFIRQTEPAYITFKLIAVVGNTLYMTGAFPHSQILAGAISRYPLKKVKCLTLREDSTQIRRLRVSDWKALLTVVPALESLHILATGSPQATRAVVSALRPPRLFPPLLPTLDGLVCPGLKKVEITEELDLPFLHICTVSSERLMCGALELEFLFRGSSPPASSIPACGIRLIDRQRL
ncbi:hypothetical protein C8F04DRAFT_1259330 [Mycena alexandri]|uniref:F-box domain-containing protein n=1 Tax=Mycena alexandri TaxID=1745969 RepID=A0AAD6SWZ2_9AGAR|nr:hypothetical protein C8F04DRAFT_1259330 [Mycena alexandri]